MIQEPDLFSIQAKFKFGSMGGIHTHISGSGLGGWAQNYMNHPRPLCSRVQEVGPNLEPDIKWVSNKVVTVFYGSDQVKWKPVLGSKK